MLSFTDQVKLIQKQLMQASADYAEAKIQSTHLDQLLGFRYEDIEESLLKTHQDSIFSSERQFWYGLELPSLQTPYSEIHEMVKRLKPQDHELWLDLGAAYGRMGIFLGFLYPKVRFIGYEYVSERVCEANRVFQDWKLESVVMKQADLATESFQVEQADLYFIYDFGSKTDVYRVLEKLRLIAQTKKIRVIARGRGVRNWILMDFPWLYDVCPAEHYLNWSLFQS